MSKMYVLRIRRPDGSWNFDMENPMPKREAEYESKRLRIWLGVSSQLWDQKEAAALASQGVPEHE